MDNRDYFYRPFTNRGEIWWKRVSLVHESASEQLFYKNLYETNGDNSHFLPGYTILRNSDDHVQIAMGF
jgi:hypothetical protein